jgi:Ca2+-binding EF-hand superfamily protein
MVGLTTEYKIACFLQTLSNGEKDIEISRQVLAERSAFEPYTAFKRITRLATTSLTVYQVIDFLRENDFIALEKDVRNVFRQYSTSVDGRLSYADFLEVVLPKTSPVLREIATQRPSYYVAEDEILPYEVELGLAKIFDKEVALARKAEILKEEIAARYDFGLRAAYEVVAEVNNLGRVDYDALYTFLQKNNISVIEKDVSALLRRIDTDRDGRCTYSEFTQALIPSDAYYRRIAETATPRTRSVGRTRVASPTRISSPVRVASPSRVSSRLNTSNAFNQASHKLNDYDYINYLSDSAIINRARTRSTGRISTSPRRVASPTRTSGRVGYETPTRGRSPVRNEVVSPMKGLEEDHLAKALVEQVELDKELEATKNKLALQEDFNTFDAFRCFDLTEKGYITRLELKDALNDIDIFPTSAELLLIQKRYNKDEDGLIKYHEFIEIIKPKDTVYAGLLTARRPTYADREDLSLVFSSYTVELLRKVLNKVIENEYHSEKVRQRLSRRPLFDAFEAFEALDKDHKGYLNKADIRELLADHGFYATQKELQNLVSRYDYNEDGKVSYSEFVKEINPKSPERI